MRKNTYIIATFLILATGIGLAQQPAPVKIESGLIQGMYENDLTVYKGIPFAAPPVGDLHWRPPQPAAQGKEVRKADKFAPGPIQGQNFLFGKIYLMSSNGRVQ